MFDSAPVTSGSASYLISNYNYNNGTADSSATVDTPPATFMEWATNLTKAWENANLGGDYDKATGVQGENYTTFIYQLLYLVKYANNDSQEMIGYGNTYSYDNYSGQQHQVLKKQTEQHLHQRIIIICLRRVVEL